MKKLILFFCLFFILFLGGIGLVLKRHYRSIYEAEHLNPILLNHPVIVQVRASHMIRFSLKDVPGSFHDFGSYCTATVVGPHAIITAEHCNEGDEKQFITFDYAPIFFKIIAAIHSNQEQVLYLLDGPEFKDISPYKPRRPKIGEECLIYGFGGKEYPARLKSGYILNEYDPSEVNKGVNFFYSSSHVIPGDSGAMVYGRDGAMLGTVTFILYDAKSDRRETGGFQLDFSENDILVAQEYK